MSRSEWWDKCVPAVSPPPESLLYGERGPRIMRLEFSPSPFDGSLSRFSSRRRPRCVGNFVVCALVIVTLLCVTKYILKNWPCGKAGFRHYEHKFAEGVSNGTISGYLRELTKDPHLAGTKENFVTADYVYANLVGAGITTHFTDYDVLLSVPKYRSLTMFGTEEFDGAFELLEEEIDEDPYTKEKEIIRSFHAYSPNANMTGEVVYANYGREEDFDLLLREGVDLSGAIILARYGQIYRGDIVNNAALRGAAAAIVFSDPFDYAHNGTEGYYPDSRWLPPTGIQRGSVYQGVGDPLTPGWASVPGTERIDEKDAHMPKIPSLPISGSDAQRILKGLRGKTAPAAWRGGLRDVNYTIGRGPAKLRFVYEGINTTRSIRNVVGMIEGCEEPDRYVVLGNHRDAWVFGAVDPSSGTASLLELARGFGVLLGQGWRPRRSIVLASWDAEEYGLIGSTEWVEDNLGILGARAVAYLNVDCAVSGPGFMASSTPQLDSLLQEVTKMVEDPEGQYATIFDSWQAASSSGIPKISRLGGGDSDFASFLQHAGVPALDIYFGEEYPVYHSAYDDYNWMVKFGDPQFRRHVALAKLWGLLALRMADDAVLPFNYLVYAKELQNYAHELRLALEKEKAPTSITINPLHTSVAKLMESAADIREESNIFQRFKPNPSEFFYFLLRRRAINDRLMLAERGFLDSGGLKGPGRSWYKHLVYGPAGNNNYGTSNFPGIVDALVGAFRSGNDIEWRALQHEIWRVSRAIDSVSATLRGRLS